jgi:uncharacterized protein YjbI with pentapeptide repeats
VDPKSKRDSEQDFLLPPARDRKSRWGLQGKTVWDWLQLLIVPLMLALITVVFTWQQNVRQNELEDQRVREAQKIENRRAAAERELAEERAQDEALQAYLDQMSTLMLEKDLRNSGTDSEVSTLARARTLSVLRRVDTSHKDEIMQFLLEAGLVQQEKYFREGAPVYRGPVILLHGANLGDTDLEFASLFMAVLTEADLSGANLRRALLQGAHLYRADLTNAKLIQADLTNVNLIEADLSGADLSDAEGITNEELEQQSSSLEGATMPNGQKYEDWLKSKDQEENKKSDGSS